VGDAVACLDPEGRVVARGLVNYSSADVAKICGLKTSEIAKRLGYKYYDEVIHCDNLVVVDEVRGA
jgi:glutamate 5-kinase